MLNQPIRTITSQKISNLNSSAVGTVYITGTHTHISNDLYNLIADCLLRPNYPRFLSPSSPRHGASSCANKRTTSRLWRVTVNVFNKQSLTADKNFPPGCGFAEKWKLLTRRQAMKSYTASVSYLAVDTWAVAKMRTSIFTADKIYKQGRIADKTLDMGLLYSNDKLQCLIYIYRYQYRQVYVDFLIQGFILYRKNFV